MTACLLKKSSTKWKLGNNYVHTFIFSFIKWGSLEIFKISGNTPFERKWFIKSDMLGDKVAIETKKVFYTLLRPKTGKTLVTIIEYNNNTIIELN
jgi:hypothetical protein